MKHTAYLRVSTDAQDVENQKHGILDYANKHSMTGLKFTEDSVTSKVNWKDRGLGGLLSSLKKGDVVVFAEVSRIARSTLQVLEVLELCATKGIHAHIAKQNMIFDGSLNSKITATVLGLAAEIEREFISMRTTESLNARKRQIEEEGFFISKKGNKITTLGRPKGRARHVRLDDHRDEIKGYLKKGINKRAIAKLVDAAPSTLYDWMRREGIK